MTMPAPLATAPAQLHHDAITSVPAWEPRASRLLDELAGQVTLIGAATPTNLHTELAALEVDYRRGSLRTARFIYARAPADVRVPLLRLYRQLEQQDGLLAQLYAARALELWQEAQLCQSAGSSAFVDWACQRFARRDEHDDHADVLAQQWAQIARPDETPDLVLSDNDRDPRSLVCRMRAEVGRLRLPFRVEVSPRLAALAATGPGMIYVAAGRSLRASDVERTVLHEVAGHACPRAAASHARLGLARLGSAGGSDDQEGRALWLEQRAELMCDQRRAELGRRHLAARAAHRRDPLPHTVAELQHFGASLCDALRITARAYRGGGLGRECAYLPAFLRVQAAVAEHAELDAILSRGKWSVPAARALQAAAPCLLDADRAN